MTVAELIPVLQVASGPVVSISGATASLIAFLQELNQSLTAFHLDIAQ